MSYRGWFFWRTYLTREIVLLEDVSYCRACLMGGHKCLTGDPALLEVF